MSKRGDSEAVRNDIAKLLHQPEYDDGSAGPVLVRLAWHSSGTYDAATNNGDSNGAGMRYEAEGGDPANAGLQHARVFLEPVKEKHGWITRVGIKEMGGPEIEWKSGRTDFVDDSELPPRGRLPDGAQGADHIRFIFYRMGFSDQEIVALSGAHNLGRCHSDRSGFHGAWVNNPTRFSNSYYRLMLLLNWKQKTLPNGVRQFVHYDEDLDEELMMLPTDLALVSDRSFRPWVELYANNKERFFADFAKVFAKLTEPGIQRDWDGMVVNKENAEHGYQSAPKKGGRLGREMEVDGAYEEAQPLRDEDMQFRARL